MASLQMPLGTRRATELLIRLSLTLAVVGFVCALPSSSPAAAHGGGLDGSGGHNCYVGSCAGTYHCHRYYGGRCTRTVTTQPVVTSPPATVPRVTTPPATTPRVTSPPRTTTTVLRVANCISSLGGNNARSEVALLQTALKEIGTYRYSVDGEFGDGTANAVRRTAASLRLVLPDPFEPTAEFLRAIGVSCGEFDAPTLRQTSLAPEDASDCVDPSNDLDPDEVLLLQWALTERTFDVGPQDGLFGQRTLAVLQAYETTIGIENGSKDRASVYPETVRWLGISCDLPLTPPTTTTTTSSTSTTTSSTVPPTTTTVAKDLPASPASQQDPGGEAMLFVVGGLCGVMVGSIGTMLLRRRFD